MSRLTEKSERLLTCLKVLYEKPKNNKINHGKIISLWSPDSQFLKIATSEEIVPRTIPKSVNIACSHPDST